MKSWLQVKDTQKNATHNEGKSAVSERYIRILRNKIYKYVASISKDGVY